MCSPKPPLRLLTQLLLRLHNGASNAFWAAHVPPSERIAARSSASERRRFLTAKYRHGKFRRFHPLYGQPEELNRVGGPRHVIQRGHPSPVT